MKTGAQLVQSLMSQSDIRVVLRDLHGENIPQTLVQSLQLEKSLPEVQIDFMNDLHNQTHVAGTQCIT